MEPVLVSQLPADPLLFLVEPHRPVQVPAGIEDERLVAEAGLQPVLVSQLPANPLRFLVEPHRPVQVPAGLEDQRLVAERAGEPVLVSQLAADPLFFLQQPHRSVQVPADLEDIRLVSESPPEPVLVSQLAADPLLFLVEPHRPVQVPAGPEDQCLVAEAGLQPVLVSQLPADPLRFLVEPHRPVQVPAAPEDQRLVAESAFQVCTITGSAVVLDEMLPERECLLRMASSLQQGCRWPYVTPVPGRVVQDRPVGVHHAPRRAGFHTGPVGPYFLLGGVPRDGEEGQDGQQVVQTLPRTRLGKLPRKLLDHPLGKVQAGEVVGQPQVGRFPGLVRRKMALADGPKKAPVIEIDQLSAA